MWSSNISVVKVAWDLLAMRKCDVTGNGLQRGVSHLTSTLRDIRFKSLADHKANYCGYKYGPVLYTQTCRRNNVNLIF
jgi:hypothetical protein